ncbi:serine/threonine-protein kinase ULK3 [Uranotaenia lowii]|uniref:serine/threonine-protein kinase ULK3 n=1 Tax=Uranotaenia lowii TaxID=190385 RepID=UPI0024798771|nr:serine/threonine-protein kinase ULK3 [Uranotaenia lowii]
MAKPNISEYQMLEKIGSGSYASVFRALKKASREIVAIKCVEKSSLSKTAVDNIVTEISLLKKLKHEHIVEMRDFLWDDRFIYIVMEYCNGGSLHAYIRQKQKLPETVCRVFLRQLALALRYMREREVCHFDLKPQNLLLMRISGHGMVLKVADFGFAQHLELGQENCNIKGSPLYMAPEILLKQRYDARADLWSIGIILYECLFGRAPYSSASLGELLEKFKNRQRIEIPKHGINSISIECEDLLSRLLKRDPDDRIAFDDFFSHSFLDLEHSPSEDNLSKAVALISEAIELDKKLDYDGAYKKYCKGLQYFVPMIQSETDPAKKRVLRERVQTYLNRAEEIKHSFQSDQLEGAEQSQQPSCSSQKKVTVTRTASQIERIKRAFEPSELYKKLYAQASSSPDLKNALEIGRQAELYARENKLDIALDSYKTVLGLLMPLLHAEPKNSGRRELLHRQILCWMEEAEQIKTVRSAQILEEVEHETSSGPAGNCSIQ